MALVGLKDIHVALLSEDRTYETPKKLAPAITANITPNTTQATLYGDDRAVETAESMGDVDVEINVTDLSTADYAFLLGKTVNSDGVVEDNSDDVAPYVALGFSAQKSNGASRYIWLYKGKFSIPTDSHQTKGESVEFQTSTIAAKFVAREDGKWRARVDSDDSGVSEDVIDNWFDAVYEPTTP
ncbi:major tail protein [Halalkalibacter oceani]|uniref:major tail protein n=1 Tax=Halalkalibacter oceani TaxID=1653776 RepID=UPI0033981BEE